jgi:hypothetical protein
MNECPHAWQAFAEIGFIAPQLPHGLNFGATTGK